MQVIKRNGQYESMRFDRISDRVIELSENLNVDSAYVTKTIISGIVDKIKTSEIDTLCAETCASLCTYNPDYDTLASRIFVSNLHKMTNGSFAETLKKLKNNTNKEGESVPLIHDDVYTFAMKYIDQIESKLDYSKDRSYTYFALKTLEKSYLLKSSLTDEPIERPQQALMRVALGIHYPRLEEYKVYDHILNSSAAANFNTFEIPYLERTFETYELLSNHMYTQASPTLFNSGTPYPQFSSCLLLNIPDSLDGIFDKLKECGMLSKFSAGLGINMSDVRPAGSRIKSTNGFSNGIIPALKMFDSMIAYVNQSGKRKGSCAVYLNMFHGDIIDFLNVKRLDGGPEELRFKNLFIGLWIEDLFMKRVDNDEMWSLFCPVTVPGLTEAYGEEFEKLYTEAEKNKKYIKQVKARDLWKMILVSQTESGQPYMLYKDHVNKKSNQKNIGTIKGSNLCTEIVEYTSPDEIAVCNLATLSLPNYIINGKFNFSTLYQVTKVIVYNLNRIIDYGFLPIEKAKQTNLKQRAIGLGVQGLQDVFFMLKYAFDSEEAKKLNREIFETIYYASWEASCELCDQYGPYEYFHGSPISKGILQCDMWESTPVTKYDWDGLRERVKKGVRNSLITTVVPSASTAQILGNTESIECMTSNIYSRKVLAGDFIVLNYHLAKDLQNIGLWKKDIIDKIKEAGGSIQTIDEIPSDIKHLYRTVWEIQQKDIIDLAISRAPFIDQTQSLNICMSTPTMSKLSSMHMYTWKNGLKTGMYYLRTKTASNAMQSGKIDIKVENLKVEKVEKEKVEKKYICTDEICTSCSG